MSVSENIDVGSMQPDPVSATSKKPEKRESRLHIPDRMHTKRKQGGKPPRGLYTRAVIKKQR